MIRYNFAIGLTVILLLLLSLSGYTVVETRRHGDQVASLISDNYDSIRAARLLRAAMTDMNLTYLAVSDRRTMPENREEWALNRGRIERQLEVIVGRAGLVDQTELAESLRVKTGRFLDTYAEYLTVSWRGGDSEFERRRAQVASLTSEIDMLANKIVEANEEALFRRRDVAAGDAHKTAIIVLAISVGSLLVYGYTSYRLTRSVLDPLRQLKDAIVRVRDRRFDQPVPVPPGPELGAIARSFNTMAHELREYLDASDARATAAKRLGQRLLDALPYPVFVVDDAGVVQMRNPRARKLNDELGACALPGAVRARLEQTVAERRDLVVTDVKQAVHIEPAGRAMEVLPQIFRVESEADSREALWAVLLIDVTELRRMDQAKTRALSMLGHEVKTPVASIRMAQLLLMEEKVGPLTPDQRELVATSRDDCERLLNVLQSLLELARLESGRAELRPTAVAPEDLFNEVAGFHAPDAELRGVAVVIEAGAEAPAVWADPLRIGRVLGNFTSNALKYGAPGRPIRLRATPLGTEFVRLSVINEGPGLTEEQQAKVFAPFYRKPGEQAEGTGLGLALASEIVAAHGGRVGVASEPGVVTEFYCDLPVAAAVILAGGEPARA